MSHPPARDFIPTLALAPRRFFRGEYRLRRFRNNSIFLDTIAKLWETPHLLTRKWIYVPFEAAAKV
jgi:hypothetical protein